MKKFLVIGNPIEHSLSPKLHNYWMKKHKIKAIYEKQNVEVSQLKSIIDKLRNENLNGVNVTVPFKKSVIKFVDKLTEESEKTKSVNTIYKQNNEIIGHNTDIAGFELSLRNCKFDVKNKNILILGAGGVVTSIISALLKMKSGKITISNRTKSKAEEIKKLFNEINILEWGRLTNFDMIINATSLGLRNNDFIDIDFDKIESGKFFYDVIYNPSETNFLKEARKHGHSVENGKYMFIYQAHQAFTIWHKQMPNIDQESIKILNV